MEFNRKLDAELKRKLHIRAVEHDRSIEEVVRLLEAEYRTACLRENYSYSNSVFDAMEWILTNRPLPNELTTILETGYLRGAD